ncbi:hypothetical protein IAR55_004332 [Kwoniella newhampshirensis]|uniref:Uncharacterized protein n=1 Tax=Kwoniella newhampshirensis TaxID=1651941 RepID=A0AAW0YJD9_9TREE
MSTSTSSITRSPSPTFSRPSYSPLPSPAPFLTPPIYESSSAWSSTSRRRSPTNNTSTRPTPYPSTSPNSPTLPTPSSPSSITGSASTARGVGVQRPGAPRRAHSFCASGQNTTYALASACSSSHLSSDKKVLVAPPLERTLSSIGSRGNNSPPNQQMSRPGIGSSGIVASQSCTPTTKGRTAVTSSQVRDGQSVLAEKDMNHQHQTPLGIASNNKFPPSHPAVPTILIHPSVTPPRPSLATIRTGSNASSRSSSYTVMTPMTPHCMLFGKIEEGEGEEAQDESKAAYADKRGSGLDSVMDGVEDLVIE